MLEMFGPVTTGSLDPILRGVSRSIFITLRVAPRAVRRQLGVAYLFCRAADTIADTRLLSRDSRLEQLQRFRAQFESDVPRGEELERIASEVGAPQAIPEEKALLLRLQECFAAYGRFEDRDRALIRKLVTTLTRGMEMDLRSFPPEESGEIKALERDEDLDLYTYYVAGCVGEFWTELQVAHIPALSSWRLPQMRELGVRFGKGLQLTNILRDVDRDLSMGRCYFPRPRLKAACVSPEDLKCGRGRERLEPVLDEYLELALDHYRAGWEYTLAIPRRVPRMRLACAWPLLIGLATLALLAKAPNPYAPGTLHKISRKDLRRILRQSTLRVFSNRALDILYRRMEREVSG
jgi:farnesyl-diphosphate farnesyltransferase